MKNLNSLVNRQNILNNTADATAMRVFFVLVFLLMSCSGVFGQNAQTEANIEVSAIENVSVSNQAVAEQNTTTSQMELVIWFMGSKQATPSATNGTSTATTAKKQLINCGMTPNRILSRTLLKKAMQYENNIA
ncbi:MAG: hypothetical protein EOO50_07820 [Flavobacterium sp.]|uniref:hypothetical protein n=1 Tax=Flavobacterium sp. TaxID=239 RepID=UPI001215737D|nr:hypothetical protein [Flavobacterium sp.]RZJ66953.1 MAG: hypothetical protein EOO50_07820 [Flavobacterium sp.]